MNDSRRHAIVLGAGMAGLLAARVLTGHFQRVTVVERDHLPSDPVFRAGVPQSRHVHALWSRGIAIVESLFPGIEEQLRAAGAPVLSVPADMLWLTPTGWRRRFPSTRMLTCSRELLEWSVRDRLARAKGVEVLSGHEGVGLITDSTGLRITGVEIRQRGQKDSSSQLLADLVIDANGRSSRTVDWLRALGCPTVPQDHVDPFLGYASRSFAIPSTFSADWKAVFLQGAPQENARSGVLFPQEGGRWIVSLFGRGNDLPPTDEDGFLNFAASLRSPVLHEAIEKAEPLTPVTSYRHTVNRRLRYEQLRGLPRRLVVLGDAACAFNPIYGHGMSVAAISAAAMDSALRTDESLDEVTHRLQKQIAKEASGAWLIATGEDSRYHTTQGPRVNIPAKIVNRYLGRVASASNVDEQVCSALMDVMVLNAPPTSLFRPTVMLRSAANRSVPSSAYPYSEEQ
ncbi:FAD-dependent monooxygenase [Streptomyces sp900105245]|uniref:FAD-dependent monooxygenase n=1 Tax=Streptomyces sp. 900105245 TaxID=3154379 RepID=A0ABV1UKL4_9ACTN